MNPANDYKRMWDEFAPSKSEAYFDRKFDPRSSVGLKNYLRERAIMAALDLRADDSFLDVGCASGRQVFKASEHCARAVGVDIAEAFVGAARSHARERSAKNTEFHEATGEDMPFGGSEFSKVLCAEVLEHVFAPEEVLMEIKRVMAPDGILVVTIPNKNGEGTWWGRLKRLATGKRFEPIHHFSAEAIHEHGDAHVREFDTASVKMLLAGQGFEVRRIVGVSFIDLPLSDKILNRTARLGPSRSILIGLERILGSFGFMARWGRHLVVTGRRAKDVSGGRG